jgi:hypothetical protein
MKTKSRVTRARLLFPAMHVRDAYASRFIFSTFVKKYGWALVMLPMFWVGVCRAAQPVVALSDFKNGNAAYQSGDFAKAIEIFESIENQGFDSPDLQLNLGNAYLKSGKTGLAILHFERALRLSPADRAAAHNLQAAQNQELRQLDQQAEILPLRWFRTFRNLLSSTGWAILAIVSIWMTCTGLGFAVLRKHTLPSLRKLAVRVFGFISLLSLGVGFSRFKFEQCSKEAIVLVGNKDLKSSPDPASPDVLTLPEGTKVQLLDSLGMWSKVQFSSGDEGWLSTEFLEKI